MYWGASFIFFESISGISYFYLWLPIHKDKFFNENILSKIPNKINRNILAVYTDYEGDYIQPYSWNFGAEVSSLDEILAGLVVKDWKLERNSYVQQAKPWSSVDS